MLVNGHGRAQAPDIVHFGLGHSLQKLPGIGREALHVAALPFGVEGIKNQTGLARTRQAGDHHQLVPGQNHIDTAQVVHAGVADFDPAAVRGCYQGIGRLGDVFCCLGGQFGRLCAGFGRFGRGFGGHGPTRAGRVLQRRLQRCGRSHQNKNHPRPWN